MDPGRLWWDCEIQIPWNSWYSNENNYFFHRSLQSKPHLSKKNHTEFCGTTLIGVLVCLTDIKIATFQFRVSEYLEYTVGNRERLFLTYSVILAARTIQLPSGLRAIVYGAFEQLFRHKSVARYQMKMKAFLRTYLSTLNFPRKRSFPRFFRNIIIMKPSLRSFFFFLNCHGVHHF